MSRYINAVECAEIISEKFNIPLYDLVDVFAEIPTADVVPKSEVARLQAEFEDKQFRCDSCDRIGLTHSEHIFCIRQAKAEIAREIFESIEKMIASMEYKANTPRKTVKVEELKEQVDWVLHEVVPNTIAELKKKYTEGVKEDTNA